MRLQTLCALVLTFITIVLWPSSVEAKEKAFEVFDGQIYNGKYYPRMDIIEWGEPSQMQFQVYWKGKDLGMAFELEEKQGKKVMLVHYHIKERDEHLCRRVLAPGHFKPEFLVYKDTSDFEMDNTILTMKPLPEKKGLVQIKNPPKYTACVEKDEEDKAKPKSSAVPAAPASPNNEPSNVAPGVDPQAAPPKVKRGRFRKGDGAIKKKDGAVPFSDW